MIIYTGALIWVILLYVFNNSGTISLTDSHETTKMQAFLAMAYLVFFIGLRSAGADTAAYLRNYSNIGTGFGRALRIAFDFRQSESLAVAYSIVMKTIFGNNFTPYLMGIAAFSGFAMSGCMRRYSENYYVSMMLFILWGTWTWMFNGIQQFWAVSICFLCLGFLDHGKPIPYIIVVLIASRIHTSALMMIPVYFLVRTEPWRPRALIPILIAALAIFFTSPFLAALETVLGGTEYESAVQSSYFTGDSGSNPIRTIVYALPLFWSFLCRDEIEREAPDYIKICVNMSLLCVCVSAIANVTSGIYIGRLPIYFSVFNMILLPWLFIHTKFGKQGGWVTALMTIYVAYFIYENYIHGHIYYYSELLGLRLM